MMRCFWALLWALGLPLLAGEGTYRVLLVGDSWADYMWADGVMRQAFADEGYPEVWEKGDVTAISVSTAAEWATPPFLQLISDELANHPTLEFAQLTMGGNDFLAGISGGGWHAAMTALEEEALLDRVEADLEVVIDHLFGLDPDLGIVISLYDYPNFQETLSGLLNFICVPLWEDLGMPTPLQVNEAESRFLARVAGFAASRPGVESVDHLGLMQFHFGYPSMSIGPGELPPPGDLDLPSPTEALRIFGNDCFHLNASGYGFLAQNLWDNYYADRFCLSTDQFGERLASWPALPCVELVADLDRLCDVPVM